MHSVPIRLSKMQKDILELQIDACGINNLSAYIKLVSMTAVKPVGHPPVMEAEYGEARDKVVVIYLSDRDYEGLIAKSQDFGFKKVSLFMRYCAIKHFLQAPERPL